MSNQALQRQNNMQLSNLEDVMQLGDVFAKSGLFSDTKQAAQCVVKILAGAELGFSPIASMMGINIIQGKVSLGANLIASKIQSSGKYDFKFRAHTEKICRLEFFRGEESLGFSEFTIEEAAKAGLSSKDIWKKYPKNMLFSRAISNGARWFTADLFSGAIYTPEEMGADVDGETGELIRQAQPQLPPYVDNVIKLPPQQVTGADDCEATGRESVAQLSIKDIAQRLVDINAVSKTPDGYTVTTGEGTRLVQKINGKVGCNCPDFIDSVDPDFQCAHIAAAYLYAKRQQELDAIAAAESAR